MRCSWVDWKVGEPFEAPIGLRNKDGKTTDVVVLVTCPNGCEPFRMAHACVRYNKGAMCISHLARAKCGLASSAVETGAGGTGEAGGAAGAGGAGVAEDDRSSAQRARDSNGAQCAQAGQVSGQATTNGLADLLFSPEVAALPPSKRSRPTRETHKQCREQIEDLQQQLKNVTERVDRMERCRAAVYEALGATSPPHSSDDEAAAAERATRAVANVVKGVRVDTQAEIETLRDKVRDQDTMLKLSSKHLSLVIGGPS